jgi:FkbM family methyltransferase
MLREETFFESEQQIFTVLRNVGFSPASIIDIGASNGEWTRRCLPIFPAANYKLYEPLYSHLPDYKEGLDKLTAAHPNVSLRKIALADKSGTADFYLTPNSVGSSLLPLADAKKIQIELSTLDNEFSAAGDSLDILKMDTQGGELRILQGGKSVVRRSRVVVVESWLYPGYGPPTPLAHQIIDELSKYDFRVFAIGGPYSDPQNVLYALDLYFGSADVLAQLGSHPFADGKVP